MFALCALLACTGVTWRGTAPCTAPTGYAEQPVGSCCGTDRCHCGGPGLAKRCCDTPAPDRAPRDDAPRPQPLATDTSAPCPRPTPVLDAPDVVARRDSGSLEEGAFAARTRPETLSVWRC